MADSTLHSSLFIGCGNATSKIIMNKSTYLRAVSPNFLEVESILARS
eukprot:SAG31_NODE_16716_length_698_cov_2.153589_1_plen_46_part_10